MRDGKQGRCATLLDLYHLSKIGTGHQTSQNNGRVVLRGDIVRCDSGNFGVFIEKGCLNIMYCGSTSLRHDLQTSCMIETSDRRYERTGAGENESRT